MSRPFPRRKLHPVIEEARAAYRDGGVTFVAGMSLRDGKRATRKQTEQGAAEIIAAVEGVGWTFVEQSMADPWTIEFGFVRL
jgi:hypothetical protein